jgi:uncharacterized protein
MNKGGSPLYPKEYIQYLVHFHGDGDFFECHEILEEFWKKTDFGNKHSIWIGFIQLAVSSYHHRRGNFAGAKKTLKKAIEIFLTKENSIPRLGLNYHSLLSILSEQLGSIEQKRGFNPFHLPIDDHSLLIECKCICQEKGFKWGSNSHLSNKYIVHRHKLRDRTDIIQKRRYSILNKEGNE